MTSSAIAVAMVNLMVKSLRLRRTPVSAAGNERPSWRDLALGAGGLVERGAQALGELDGVVIGPEVHEDQARLLGQHVAVDRGDLDAIRAQGLDHGIDLRGG